MIIHERKCLPEYFEPIVSGDKTFEIRQEHLSEIPKGRGCVFEAGDILFLREYDQAGEYSGRITLRYITYVMRNELNIQPTWCVMSIKPLPWDIL